MSANAWKARKGHPDALVERNDNQQCRFPGCILKRNGPGARRHVVHFVPDMRLVPEGSWMMGSNRKGRRRARKTDAIVRRRATQRGL